MPVHDQLLGSTQPVLSISLEPGESIVAETGEFAWMTDSIQMTAGPAGLSDYTATDQAGTIAFASRLPGSILHIEVTPGREYLVHRNGFLAGTPGIEVTIGFQQPLEATEAPADEFILRRIGGRGRAWVELSGDVVRRDLAAGHVAAHASLAHRHVRCVGRRPDGRACRACCQSPGHGRPALRRPVRPRNRVAAVDAAARRVRRLAAGPCGSPYRLSRGQPVRTAPTRSRFSPQSKSEVSKDMNRNAAGPRGLAGAVAVVAIAAGLVLAGCGGSSSSGSVVRTAPLLGSAHPPASHSSRLGRLRRSVSHHSHRAVPRRRRRHLDVQDHLRQDRQQDDRGDAGLRRPAGDDEQRHHRRWAHHSRHRVLRGPLGRLDLAAVQPVRHQQLGHLGQAHLRQHLLAAGWPSLRRARPITTR